MGILSSGGMGLDLGSANVTICLQNEGVVLREPSYVLTMRDSIEDILAVGRDAKQMVGRTPKDVSLVSPRELRRGGRRRICGGDADADAFRKGARQTARAREKPSGRFVFARTDAR